MRMMAKITGCLVTLGGLHLSCADEIPYGIPVLHEFTGFTAEQQERVERLLEQDSCCVPPAPFGALYFKLHQADAEFFVFCITGYTSGRDANTVMVYRAVAGAWHLCCVLDMENLGSARVEMRHAAPTHLKVNVSATPQCQPYSHNLPVDVTAASSRAPEFLVTPQGVFDKNAPVPPDFFHVTQ